MSRPRRTVRRRKAAPAAPANPAAIRRRALAWFGENARELPWRGASDPYAVWVSEVMLQQTQVATVIPYYERFLAAFPSPQALAAADETLVLRHWEGLGYYRRARQLHAAARQIVQRHDGSFPREFAALRALPGVGRYTAGAVLSIACDARHPILEANTVRLFSRLLAYRGDPASRIGQTRLWQFAENLLPLRGSGSGRLNQALMELGALVCTPKSPDCTACPLRSLCPTFRGGWQDRIPRPKKPPAWEDLHEVALVAVRDGRFLVRRCRPGERWAGLWDFLRFGVPAGEPASAARRIQNRAHALYGLKLRLGQHLTRIRHGVTRFRITLDVYNARILSGRSPSSDDFRWTDAEELVQLPLSTTGRKIARLLTGKSPAISANAAANK